MGCTAQLEPLSCLALASLAEVRSSLGLASMSLPLLACAACIQRLVKVCLSGQTKAKLLVCQGVVCRSVRAARHGRQAAGHTWDIMRPTPEPTPTPAPARQVRARRERDM